MASLGATGVMAGFPPICVHNLVFNGCFSLILDNRDILHTADKIYKKTKSKLSQHEDNQK